MNSNISCLQFTTTVKGNSRENRCTLQSMFINRYTRFIVEPKISLPKTTDQRGKLGRSPLLFFSPEVCAFISTSNSLRKLCKHFYLSKRFFSSLLILFLSVRIFYFYFSVLQFPLTMQYNDRK